MIHTHCIKLYLCIFNNAPFDNNWENFNDMPHIKFPSLGILFNECIICYHRSLAHIEGIVIFRFIFHSSISEILPHIAGNALHIHFWEHFYCSSHKLESLIFISLLRKLLEADPLMLHSSSSSFLGFIFQLENWFCWMLMLQALFHIFIVFFLPSFMYLFLLQTKKYYIFQSLKI